MADTLKRRNPGWYAGAAAFWLFAAWLVTVGLWSIIPQIFRTTNEPSPAHVAGGCRESLLRLDEELRGKLSVAIAQPGQTRGELDSWLSDWDQRLAATRRACPEPVAPAGQMLSSVRHGLRDTLRKIDREQGPRMRNLRNALSSSNL